MKSRMSLRSGLTRSEIPRSMCASPVFLFICDAFVLRVDADQQRATCHRESRAILIQAN
jgi:hypothetical protein